MSGKARLTLRRVLAGVCYLLMLAADGGILRVILLSYNGGITYYLGQLIFVPVFIFSYWMITFFMQLTEGKVEETCVAPKKLRRILNGISSLISLAFLGFWGYIYIMLLMNEPSNAALM